MGSRSEAGPDARIVGLYDEHAGAWDRMRGADASLEKPWLDRFTALLPPRGTVLDLGCGSGRPVAAELIDRRFRVTGLDSSLSLIALCRARYPGEQWVVADLRSFDLGRRFDGIVAWHSLFHLTREAQRALFPRLAAHVAPGGALMFTSGHEDGVRVGTWQGEPLYHASLAPEAYRALLDTHGFQVVEHALRDPQCGEATVWIARRRHTPD